MLQSKTPRLQTDRAFHVADVEGFSSTSRNVRQLGKSSSENDWPRIIESPQLGLQSGSRLSLVIAGSHGQVQNEPPLY